LHQTSEDCVKVYGQVPGIIFRQHDRSNLALQEMTEALNRDYDIRVRHQPEDRKALDLDVPLSLKQRADEMIE
jgi:hypothetical protein